MSGNAPPYFLVSRCRDPGDHAEDAQRCFFSSIGIPVLANGRSISNVFWNLGQPDSWPAGAAIPVTLRYRDLSGRRFSNRVRLLVADDPGFAQAFWGSGQRNDG